MSKAAFRDALKACDGNQAELGRRIGVSKHSVNKWFERGVPKVHRETVLGIARAFRLKK